MNSQLVSLETNDTIYYIANFMGKMLIDVNLSTFRWRYLHATEQQ